MVSLPFFWNLIPDNNNYHSYRFLACLHACLYSLHGLGQCLYTCLLKKLLPFKASSLSVIRSPVVGWGSEYSSLSCLREDLFSTSLVVTGAAGIGSDKSCLHEVQVACYQDCIPENRKNCLAYRSLTLPCLQVSLSSHLIRL